MRDMLLGEVANQHKEDNEFYPYRYLASEGFLPGYNFTKLPLRAMLQFHGDRDLNCISRPAHLALVEFGPQNIIYHSGGKFRVNRMMLQGNVKEQQHRFTINPNSGVIYKDEQNSATHTDLLTGEDLCNVARPISGFCIEARDMFAVETEHITCHEEERSRKYYQVDTYFSSDDPKTISVCEIKSNGQHLANVHYLPSCRLTSILSRKGKGNSGFMLDTQSGFWMTDDRMRQVESANPNDPSIAERYIPVKLFVESTANAIYLQPASALLLKDADAVRTFLYAFKQAIEEVFQVEGREIGVELMGDEEHPNIFVYENAEGSLGVLSRLIADPASYHAVMREAYRICYATDEELTDSQVNDLAPADYSNLLNYYNQAYHASIDIRTVYNSLRLLKSSEVEVRRAGQTVGYEEQFKALMAARDQNSSTEETFLKYLHDHKLRLPDKAQPTFEREDYYVQPDFQYGDRILVFCDGTPHDRPDVQEDDRVKRKVLRNAGYRVVVWHYATPIADFVHANAHIFTPVE